MQAHTPASPRPPCTTASRCRTAILARSSAHVGHVFTAPSSSSRGFLPVHDPPRRLSVPGAEEWEDTLTDLPRLVVAGGRSGVVRTSLAALPPFPTSAVLQATEAEQYRAYTLLSFLAHGYLWCELGEPPPPVLPSVLAQPWCAISRALDMPPVLTYATYNLLNFRRLRPQGEVALGNIVCLQNFLGGVDEEHFRLVHVEIEAQAAPALAALEPMVLGALQGDADAVESGLRTVVEGLERMQAVLARMGEKCDPSIYYARVRLPMCGWRGNPQLPNGLTYEAAGPQGEDLRLELWGETGAQSSILPALDAALGVQHQGASWLRAYLDDMRGHMPPPHRHFLQHLERLSGHTQDSRDPSSQASSQQQEHCVRAMCTRTRALQEPYNEALAALTKFRTQHRAFANAYIAKFNAAEKGTGGTDFMQALTAYRDATASAKLSSS